MRNVISKAAVATVAACRSERFWSPRPSRRLRGSAWAAAVSRLSRRLRRPGLGYGYGGWGSPWWGYAGWGYPGWGYDYDPGWDSGGG